LSSYRPSQLSVAGSKGHVFVLDRDPVWARLAAQLLRNYSLRNQLVDRLLQEFTDAVNWRPYCLNDAVTKENCLAQNFLAWRSIVSGHLESSHVASGLKHFFRYHSYSEER